MKQIAVFATLAALVLGLIALTTSAPNAPPGEVTLAAIDLDADLTSFDIEQAIVHDTHAAILAEVLLDLEAERVQVADVHDHMPILNEHEMEVPSYSGDSRPTDARNALDHDRSLTRNTPTPQRLGIALC